MARAYILSALSAVFVLTFFVTLQYLPSYEFPVVSSFHFHYQVPSYRHSETYETPNPSTEEWLNTKRADGSQYLAGVGKADITGYLVLSSLRD